MSKSRGWMITINNPEVNTFEKLLQCPTVSEIVAVLERGESGTLHYQGYLQLESPRGMTFLKKLNQRANYQIRNGSRSQAFAYCTKTLDLDAMSELSPNTSTIVSYLTNSPDTTGDISSELPRVIIKDLSGTWKEIANNIVKPKKVKLSERLKIIQEKIHSNVSDKDISKEYFEDWIRYGKRFNDYRILHTSERNEKTHIIVIQGPTGTGKSHYCQATYPGAYWKSKDAWWDGYQQQETVIIDEYYGWLPYDNLLRLCDKYPLQVEIKGGKLNFNSKRIIFTTNKPPGEWYKNVYLKAFIRRVDEWMIFGTVFRSIYTDYSKVKFIDINGEDQSGDVENTLVNNFNELLI